MIRVRVKWEVFWRACRISPQSAPELPAKLLGEILPYRTYTYDDLGVQGNADLGYFLAAKRKELERKSVEGSLTQPYPPSPPTSSDR